MDLYSQVLTYCGAAVLHRTKKLGLMCSAVQEGEQIATALLSNDVIYARNVACALGDPQPGPTMLGSDNLANVQVAMRQGAANRSKHMLRRYYTGSCSASTAARSRSCTSRTSTIPPTSSRNGCPRPSSTSPSDTCAESTLDLLASQHLASRKSARSAPLSHEACIAAVIAPARHAARRPRSGPPRPPEGRPCWATHP